MLKTFYGRNLQSQQNKLQPTQVPKILQCLLAKKLFADRHLGDPISNRLVDPKFALSTKYFVGRMSVGQMSAGQMSAIQMSLAKCLVAKCL